MQSEGVFIPREALVDRVAPIPRSVPLLSRHRRLDVHGLQNELSVTWQCALRDRDRPTCGSSWAWRLLIVRKMRVVKTWTVAGQVR